MKTSLSLARRPSFPGPLFSSSRPGRWPAQPNFPSLLLFQRASLSPPSSRGPSRVGPLCSACLAPASAPHRMHARGPLRPSPARRSAAPVPHSLTPGPLGQTPARALPLSLTALLAPPVSTLSFLPRRIPFLPRAPPSFSRPVNGAAMQGMRPPSPTHGRRPTRPLPSFFLRLCPPIKTRPSPPLCPFLGSPFQSPPPPLSHCSGVDSTSSTSPKARTLSYAPVGTFNLPFWP